jgi:hypothetical protein
MICRISKRLISSKASFGLVNTSNCGIFKTKISKDDDNLKPYQKLFFSPPISQINIKMSLAVKEIRPKVSFIMCARCA